MSTPVIVALLAGLVTVGVTVLLHTDMAARRFAGLAVALRGFTAALVFSLKGITGGLIDLTAFIEYQRRTPTPSNQIAFGGHERFEAYTDCPTCGMFDHHRWREPLPSPLTRQWSSTTVWGGEVVRAAPRWQQETVYDVIRVCAHCGQEWGQG